MRTTRATAGLAIFLLVLSFPLLADRSEKAKKTGGRMMCMCGCNQILTACNHVGCTVSAEMLKKLDQHVERNEPEDLTIQSFIQEYGQKVLAQPPSTGFGVVAWLTPAAAALLGLLIIWMVMNQWRRAPQIAGPASQLSPEALDRARRQIAQETDE